jgi:cell division protein FtsW (lipid II flippase)
MKAENISLTAAALLAGLGFLALWGAAAKLPEGSRLLATEAAWLLWAGLVGVLFYSQPLTVWLRRSPVLYALSMSAMGAALLLPKPPGASFISTDVLFGHVATLSALPVMLAAAHFLQGEKGPSLSLKGLASVLAVFAVPSALLLMRESHALLWAYLVILLMALLAVNLNRHLWMWLALATHTALLVITLHGMRPFRVSHFLPAFPDPSTLKAIGGFKSLVALSTGGLFGKGLGGSDLSLCEGFVDFNHQFAFAYFGEQFGFPGVVMVLCLSALLPITCLRLARRVEDRGRCFLLAAVAWFLAWHVFTHAGAVSLMVPAMGFPFPFFPSGPAAAAFTSMLAIVLRIMKDSGHGSSTCNPKRRLCA